MESLSQTESTKTALLRVVLAGLPRIQFVSGNGIAAILRRDVVRAGIDPLEVREWMATVGGHEAETYLRGPRMSLARQECRQPINPEPYFAIPLDAFEARGARAA